MKEKRKKIVEHVRDFFRHMCSTKYIVLDRKIAEANCYHDCITFDPHSNNREIVDFINYVVTNDLQKNDLEFWVEQKQDTIEKEVVPVEVELVRVDNYWLWKFSTDIFTRVKIPEHKHKQTLSYDYNSYVVFNDLIAWRDRHRAPCDYSYSRGREAFDKAKEYTEKQEETK